jgi:hypothetical protein
LSSLLGFNGRTTTQSLTTALKGFMVRQNNSRTSREESCDQPPGFTGRSSPSERLSKESYVQNPWEILQGRKRQGPNISEGETLYATNENGENIPVSRTQNSANQGTHENGATVSTTQQSIIPRFRSSEAAPKKVRPPSGLQSHEIEDADACKCAIFRWPGGPAVLLEAERMAQSFCRVRQKLESSKNSGTKMVLHIL